MSQGGAGSFDPEMRAGDADRERLVEQLREHHAAGRLTLDEFEDRMGKAYAAKTYGELRTLTRDLPVDLAQLNVQQAMDRSTRPQNDLGSIVQSAMQDAMSRRAARDAARAARWAGHDAARAARMQRRHHGGWTSSFSSWLAGAVLLTGLWVIIGLAGGGWGYFWPIWPIGITGLLMLTRVIKGR